MLAGTQTHRHARPLIKIGLIRHVIVIVSKEGALPSLASYGHDLYSCKKIKVKGVGWFKR